MHDDPIARTSALLRALADAAPERVSIGAIGDALGRRRPGIAILCLALPNCIPGPYVPGLSTMLALPMIWIGAQLVLRNAGARLPGFMYRVTVSHDRFARFVDRVAPWMIRMEQRVGPRPSLLTTPGGRRCLGLVLILYAIVLALPIPFGNLPIGFGIAVLAIGLIEGDSRALGWGLAIGVGGILWQVFLVTLGLKAITAL